MTLTREQAGLWAAVNLPFLLCHPHAPLLGDDLIRSLAVNLVLFIAPGLPLAGPLLKRRGPSPLNLLWVVAASAALSLIVLLATLLLGAEPEAGRVWNGVWLATNAAMLVNVYVKAPSLRPLLPERGSALVGLVLFAGAYALYFQGATRFVPPMEDHDYETQGTGYGLLTSLRPTLLTDRGTDLFFAHPPLLHFYAAGSFLYWDKLERLASYDAVWRGAQARAARVKALYAQYRSDPARLPTRTPNIFLAALTVALLGAWARGLTGRAWFGLLLGAAYATSPEVFVRSSYGGYFAIGQFAVLLLLLAVSPRDLFLAGAFAALADHKLALLPVTLAAWEAYRKKDLRAALHPAAVGFAAGYALFWLYGLSINAGVFWLDHVRSHLLDRVIHHNPLGYGGYPGPAALWLEFTRNTGWLLLPLGAAALAARPQRAAWAAWAAVTALAFTVVDWRQTKHLAPLLLPLFMAPAAWAAAERRGLRASVGVLLLLCAWNLQAVWALCRDFAGFVVTPAW